MANTAQIILTLVDKATASLNNVEKSVGKLEQNVNKSNASMKKLESTAKKVGAAIAAAFAGGKVVSVAADFEDLRDSLSAVEGSVSAGATAFEKISDFATSTQFSVQDLTKAYIKLKANGVDPTNYGLQNMDELMTMFTDTAAITTDQIGALEAMSDLFSRTTAGGLGLEDLNRLADRGVPVFDMLQKTLGKNRLQLSDLGKSADGAKLILRALSNEINDRFGGATESRMDNLSTAMSNFGIAMDLAGDRFFRELGPALAELINALSRGITIITPFIGAIGDLIARFDLVIPAVAGLTLAFGTLIRTGLIKASVALMGVAERVATAGAASYNAAGQIIMVDKAFTTTQLAAIKLGKGLGIVATGFIYLNKVAKLAGVVGIIISILSLFVDWEKALNLVAQGWLYVKRAAMQAMDFLGLGDWSENIAQATEDLEKLKQEYDEIGKEVEDYSEVIEDNTAVIEENTGVTDEYKEELGKLENQVEKVEKAFTDYQKTLLNEVKLAGKSNDERREATEIMKAQEALAKSLGKTIEELTEAEKEQAETFVKGQLAKIRAAEDAADAIRKLEEDRKQFTQRTDQILEQSYLKYATEVERIEYEKQQFLQRARELGLENAKGTLDALAAYDKDIAQKQIEIAREKHREIIDFSNRALESQKDSYDIYTDRIRELNEALNDDLIASEIDKDAVLRQINKDYADAVTKEYDDLYGLLDEKIKEFTGLTSKEFGILEEVVQLTFGVNITDIIKQTFAAGIRSILGFRTQGANELGGFAGQTPGIFGPISSTIEGTFLQTGLSAIGSFVSNALGSLGGLASGIFSLFGGVGDFLGSTFGGAFRSISGAIGSLFGGGGGGGGGIGGFLSAAGSAIFGPIGGFVGSLFGGLFADGGYIRPGTIGVVGEQGPELVQGPASVFSNSDSQGMLGGDNINITFQVNAIDASGFDTMLVQKKALITDLVRSAVENRPSRQGAF